MKLDLKNSGNLLVQGIINLLEWDMGACISYPNYNKEHIHFQKEKKNDPQHVCKVITHLEERGQLGFSFLEDGKAHNLTLNPNKANINSLKPTMGLGHLIQFTRSYLINQPQ